MHVWQLVAAEESESCPAIQLAPTTSAGFRLICNSTQQFWVLFFFIHFKIAWEKDLFRASNKQCETGHQSLRFSAVLILLNACSMSWFCTACFIQEKVEDGHQICSILLSGLVGNTVSTGGDSSVKWHVHTHELTWTVTDSITRISSKQAIPIQDFQGFKSFGFLFAEACFQASKQTQIWNCMWEWAEKPKPQSQLMTIGSLELKMKYPLGSFKKTTLWESWLSSNSPMQRLLSLNGKFYQRDAEQNLSTTLPLHHNFLFALSSWPLLTASQKSLLDGSFKQMEKSDTRSVKSVLGKWISILWPHDFCPRNRLQRGRWTQLGASSHHLPFALYRQ